MSGETSRIGDYEILNLLGAGGMGRVYKVRNVITDRVEAMKVLLPEIAGNEEVAARFLREIKVLAALNHPNIAALHTAVTIDNQLVMIMEFVEGQALSAMLAAGPIPPADALSYMDQILDALSFAHQRHVIHRDIKPANMMLTPAGAVKLMDFGIARTDDESSALTAPGSTLGSMNYMSPEQVKGERTDERSDLYSLGISLYELVTASRPFHGDTSYALMNAHLNEPPRPPIELQPDMPAGLNHIILTSIAKNPPERFQSAEAFRTAVKRVLQELQESKTVFQASRDASPTGSRTPLPQARTGPITRPKPAVGAAPPTATPVPLANRIATAQRAAAPQAPTVSTSAPAATAPTAAAAAAAPQATQFAPPPAPAAAPAQMIPPASHRGLYMGIGAALVLVVVVAAAFYMPKTRGTSAATENTVQRQQQSPTTPPIAPAAQTSPTQAPAAQTPPAETTPAAVPAQTPQLPAGRKQRLLANSSRAQTPPANQAAAAPPGPSAAELDQAEREVDQLTGRAGAVNSSLETLKRQQAASGYGLRGDMAERQASMKLNISKAQEAIGRNDLARAKRYAALAAADIEALERFLGR
ncbi:MAG: protein kinase domain-containing protein [Terriglobales bacterium]